MGTKRVYTIKEIAAATGYSTVTVHNDLKSGVFHAKRANPGKTWIKLYLGPSLAKYMQEQKAKKDARAAKPRPSRAGRIGQARAKKINKLLEILKNKEEVDAHEKELAIGFFNSMFALLDARFGLKPRPAVYHLLEGIEALFKTDLLFVEKRFVHLDDEIKKLPTRSET